jgi:hypothetical protein
MPVKVGLQYIEIWQESMEDAIRAYEQEPLHKGQIVFYGPSYFTRWCERYGMTPMREVLLGKSGAPCVVNRGFGSSSAEHQLYYYARAVRPLEPKVLVYNFFANGPSFGYSDEESWELAQRVIAWARTDFPGIRIYLMGPQKSVENSPEKLESMRRCSAWVKEFAENTPNCFFLDTMDYAPLDRTDIFVEDGVHFNQEGYRIYGEYFKEALKEELDQF